MHDNQQSASIVSEKLKPQHHSLYQKPKTSLFLDKAIDIQSGATDVLESQGNGYLTS